MLNCPITRVLIHVCLKIVKWHEMAERKKRSGQNVIMPPRQPPSPHITSVCLLKGRNAAARTLSFPPENPLHHTSAGRTLLFPPETPFTTPHVRVSSERKKRSGQNVIMRLQKKSSPHLTPVCLLKGRNAAARTLLCLPLNPLHHTSRPCVF